MRIPWVNRVLELRSTKQPRPDPWADFWYERAANQTTTGIDVTEDSALTSSAVWACVRVISETLANLPLHIYRRISGGGKERATDHPAYYLLHDAPNPEMTAMQMRECLQAHLLLYGNAYAQIVWNMRGDPLAIWPLRPDRMTPRRNDSDELVYDYELGVGKPITFPRSEILHIAGLAFNGLIGYSPVKYACDSISLGQAAQQYGGRFFSNDAMPRVALTHPGTLKDPALQSLRERWNTAYGGLSKAHRVAILEEGMNIVKIGIEAEKAQLIQSRKFQVIEIARIYRVPPHMIMDLERATFSNIEHQGIDFVVHTMMPWAVRWEQQINLKLLGGKFFAQHLMDGLLRGDIKSRYDAYAVGRNWGWLSVNDIRRLENMNPIPRGDDYLQPLNMTVIGEPKPTPDQPPTEEEIQQAASALRQLRLIGRK